MNAIGQRVDDIDVGRLAGTIVVDGQGIGHVATLGDAGWTTLGEFDIGRLGDEGVGRITIVA